jgi:DNA-binding HxlR family transcriptional regulator
MAKTSPPEEQSSPLAEALASVGDRWSLLVIEALLDGPLRFNDLLGGIAGIAPNILSHRLRHLESQALIVAEPYSERPPRSLYELTPAGRELAGALRLLTDWGARHTEAGDAPRHRACGTSLEARWYCPTCAEPVDEDARDDLHFV